MLSTFRYLNTSVVAPSGAGALFVFSFLVVCSITDTWKTLVSAPGSWVIFVLLGQLMSAGSNCYAIALAFSELELPTLLLSCQRRSKVLGGGTFEPCPHGLWIPAVGALAKSGGGSAFHFWILQHARSSGKAYLALGV